MLLTLITDCIGLPVSGRGFTHFMQFNMFIVQREAGTEGNHYRGNELQK